MGLTPKESVFVDKYFECNLNGTKAAIQAGYSEKTARQQASRLLTKVNIREEVDRRLQESAMSSMEVLARLSDQARSTMEDFIDPETDNVDLAKANRAARLHLIKKFTHHVSKESEHISIEIYDAQAALIQLGKVHGLFIEKTDITSNGETLRPTVYLPDIKDDGNSG